MYGDEFNWMKQDNKAKAVELAIEYAKGVKEGLNTAALMDLTREIEAFLNEGIDTQDA